jgi:hypothetical protein
VSRPTHTSSPPAPRGRRRAALLAARLALAAALGLCAALLVSCGSSGKGLIPTANATPLQADFEAVAQAAQSAGGDCTATETAIAKTEQDYNALPPSIDAGLRTRLREGIVNLKHVSLSLCSQPLSPVTTGTTARTQTATTSTTTTPTTTTPTTTTPTTTTTTPSEESGTGPGGGTVAPGQEAPSEGESHAGGVGPGGNGPPGREKKSE